MGEGEKNIVLLHFISHTRYFWGVDVLNRCKNLRLTMLAFLRCASTSLEKRSVGLVRLVHQSSSSGSSSSSPLAHLKKISGEDSEQLVKRLSAAVGEKNVSLADAVRSQHGQDEGPDLGIKPDVVVYPQSTEEVSEVRMERKKIC